tara:strand:+ start:416 stop:1093 length:678 start_codon:yes stop_codon:yes gene_type:complete
MTQKQLIELIQQHHPNMGETEIRASLNRAQDIFTAKSEVIKKTYVQNSAIGQRYYTLDPQILRIYKVQFNAVEIPRLSGMPAIDDDEFDSGTGITSSNTSSNERAWYVDSGRLGLVEKGSITKDGVTSNYNSVTAVKEIRMYTVSQAADFTADLTEISSIPTQFHEGLAYKVISDGYLKAGATEFNPQVASIFDGRFKESMSDAKKEARNAYLTSGASIVNPTSF